MSDGPDAKYESLAEVHGSVPLPRHPSFWRRLLAFVGPAYLVSVGYMDPGNWATDIAAGSRLGTSLLWVLLMSNLMALLLQSLSARLGIVRGMDLAQASRAVFGKRVSSLLWLLAELAIPATDLAEVLGSAIGLNLLFGLPLTLGVVLTALDTFLLLVLHGRGMRLMEAFVVALITIIGLCLGLEIALARPDVSSIGVGLIPSLRGEGALYLAIGILGATVMPHNLYLHSALVQSRRIVRTPAGIRAAIRFNNIDSAVALNVAFLINAALLILSAATFHRTGQHQVVEIQEAHRLLEPILGQWFAPVVFAIALIAAGQSSTITGTLAGQIVMEGYIRLRLQPIVRRLVTRALALAPALLAIFFLGESATGELLVFSQVILSLQLPFAVIPLIHLTSDRRWLGPYTVKPMLQAMAWSVAVIIVFLNVKLTAESISTWAARAGQYGWIVWLMIGAVSLCLLAFLAYVTAIPIMQRLKGLPTPAEVSLHGPATMPPVNAAPHPRRITAAVDFSAADMAVLAHTLSLARSSGRAASVVILHVVESTGAKMLGAEMQDVEARADRDRLELYCSELIELGVEASCDLGFGDVTEELARLIERHAPDLVVMGAHGHRLVGDLVHGTTVDRLRHRIKVPLLVVPQAEA
jgi:manganese transport protein